MTILRTDQIWNEQHLQVEEGGIDSETDGDPYVLEVRQ